MRPRTLTDLAPIALLLAAACNTTPLGGGGDLIAAASDGGDTMDLTVDLTAGTVADLVSGGPADLTTTATFGCGNGVCTVPATVCCSTDHGFNGQCVPSPSDCTAGISYACTGAADCQNGDVCCLLSSGAKCVPSASCAAGGDQLCKSSAECPGTQKSCCGFSPLGGGFGHCSTGGCPVSRRKYKEAIRYVDAAERRRIRDELLRYPLATWRYRKEGPSGPQRLGFIIDDVAPSQAVAPDGETVDLYGYTSMAVAALQAQESEIDELRRQVAELRRLVDAQKKRSPSRR